jgi:hypothetical protein
MHLHPRRAPLQLATTTVLVAAFWLATLPAAASCTLQVIPEHPDETWQAAIDGVRGALTAQPGDCAAVVLEIDAGYATLTFVTLDGRRAARVLHAADELSPTLAALRVTLPSPALAAASASEAPRVAAPNAPHTSPSAAPAVQLLVNALVGARFAGPGPVVGPSMLLGASLGLAHWEIGLLARWTPVYAILAPDTRAARLADVSAGLAVGRQLSLGRHAALVTGMMLSAAAQHEGWRTPDPTTGKPVHNEQDRGQALVGAYAAAVFPTSSRTHFRASLLADVDATHVGENDPPANGLPRLPWWALTLAFGLESEVL